MKTLNEYLAMPYRMEIVEGPGRGRFRGFLSGAAGLHYLRRNAGNRCGERTGCQKARLEAAIADGVMIQEPDSLEKYSGQFKLRMPRSLHRALAEHSQQEGISMNQYCVYLLAKNDALHAG